MNSLASQTPASREPSATRQIVRRAALLKARPTLHRRAVLRQAATELGLDVEARYCARGGSDAN